MSRPRRILDEPGGSGAGPGGPGAGPGGPDGPSGPEGPSPRRGPAPPLPRPWVCYGVIAGAIAMFLLDRYLSRPILDPDGTMVGVLAPLALYGPAVQQGQYWRLLGAVLEHGNALHLLFNMSVVVTLGFTLERGIGSARFLGLSLVTALGASAFSLFFNFHIVTVGASGMILGWAGAMLPVSTRQGRQDLFIWLAQVAVISLLPGVSWAGHLGGFLFGLPCGLALRMGPRVYARAIPILLFITAAVALIAAHPERRGGL